MHKQLRIAAFLETGGAGGAEHIFLAYLSALEQRGWNVHVIAGGRLDAGLEAKWQQWGPDLEFHTIQWRSRNQYVFPVVFPSIDHGKVKRLREALAEYKPDLILINQPGPDDAQGAIRAAARLEPQVPVVSFLHMAMPDLIRMRFKRLKIWWAGRVYAGVRKVITVSEANARILSERYKVSSGKVVVVGNGVPDPAGTIGRGVVEDVRPRYGIPEGACVVFWAGRFTVEKGVDVLVKAAEVALSRYPEMYFIIAGEGPLRKRLMEQAGQQTSRERILFPGWVEDVSVLLCACDIAVLPSRAESFGLFAAEAMAASKPVVASNVHGIPEVVEDGATGLLVPADDPQDLADAIQRLAADPELRQRMGQAGRMRYEEHFTLEKAADRFEAALACVLDRERPEEG